MKQNEYQRICQKKTELLDNQTTMTFHTLLKT